MPALRLLLLTFCLFGVWQESAIAAGPSTSGNAEIGFPKPLEEYNDSGTPGGLPTAMLIVVERETEDAAKAFIAEEPYRYEFTAKVAHPFSSPSVTSSEMSGVLAKATIGVSLRDAACSHFTTSL